MDAKASEDTGLMLKSGDILEDFDTQHAHIQLTYQRTQIHLFL